MPSCDVSKARQLLPTETAAVFHDRQKIISECGSDIRFHIGTVEARAFYITQLGWYTATLDNIDWKSEINAVLQNRICSKCGFSYKTPSSAPVVVTCAAGLGPIIPAVPTADWKPKILLIYYTAVILVVSVCSERK
jgi:hypothetical protein